MQILQAAELRYAQTSSAASYHQLCDEYHETLTLDPQNMVFLYQGMDRHSQEQENSQLP